MGKGFGIGALVIGILSLVVPVVSLYVVWIALLLASGAALGGDRTFVIATFTICLVNVVFLSPATWMAFAGERLQGGSGLRVITVMLFAAPLVALLLGIRKAKRSVVQPAPSLVTTAPGAASSLATHGNFCAACGARVEAGQRFCSSCGAAQG